MPTFSYRAVTTDGEVRQGSIEARSEDEAGRKLSDTGLIVLAVGQGAAAKVRSAKPKSAPKFTLGRRESFGDKEIQLFTRELAVLLRAGLPLDRALAVLSDLSGGELSKQVIAELRDGIRGGRSFSDALGDSGRFSRFYVNMVRAGEVGGVLDQVLMRLSDYLERSRALRETIVSALIYPVILLLVALVSIVILLVFVVPQFSELFADMGKALPLPTQMVISAGNVLTGYWWLILAVAVGGVYLFRRALEKPDFRRKFDRWVLRLPLAGDLALKSETVRFSRTLSTLLTSGLTVSEALSIAGATAQNTAIAESVSGIADEVRHGRRIADVLAADGRFPPLMQHLVKVGEESGDLEGMLGQVADIYDGEVQAAVKRMLAILEPALILGLGVIIAGIIISILIAILGMNELAF